MAYRIVRVSSRCKLETQLNYLVCRGDKEVRILLDEISVLIVENTQICLTSSLISELLSHKTRIVFCDNSHNPQGEVAPYEGCFDASSKLDPDNFKNDILSSFTLECSCGGRTMIIQNAVSSWCLSVLSALNGDSFKDLIDIGFKDGGVTL